MKIVSSRIVPASAVLGVLLAAGPLATASALSTVKTTTEQTRVTAIISAGDREIGRRLTTLGSLPSKIAGATHLTASDKSMLTAQVSSEQSGLTTLKTKLDAETTLAGAKVDAQSIFSDYRVYALVVPKVQLVKVADDQQVVEVKLTDLAGKLQTRLTAAKNGGKDVTALQTQLDDMTAKAQAATAISSSIEAKVINLQPSDYNSDHALLSGDRDQLKTAHGDNQAAIGDAKAIVAALKKL